MQIIEEIEVDSSDRILITKLFDKNKMPKEVLVLYDTEEKAIFFRGDIQGEWSSVQRKVDSKNRVTLPKWIIEKLGREYYLVDDSKSRHHLLIKKFFD